MYIRKNKNNWFNLGWTASSRPGGLAAFPTYDEAYDAFEDIVDNYWENVGVDEFQRYVESALYHMTHSPQTGAAEAERERQLNESHDRLYALTKPE
jgi:hypothetical protein